MDANLKRQLDLRLPKGEIPKQEEVSTLQTLPQSEAHGFSSVAALFAKAKKALFDDDEMGAPTDELPLIVSDET